MSAKPKGDAVGFPPPLMGDTPYRLSVLAESERWIALDKPAGMAVREYPWDGKRPNLDTALNFQLQAEKPELVRRGASMFGSVYYLDPEISGVALFGKHRESLSELRNCFGSEEGAFRFVFVSGPKPVELEDTFTADAPLLPHNVKPKMIPSSAKGKKSFTEFLMLAQSAHDFTVWEAKVSFFRPHQVRAHAAVHGIPVLGDVVYEGREAPTQRSLMPRKKGGGLKSSAFNGMALHLADCNLGDDLRVSSELPQPMRLLIKRLGIDTVL
ncbi:MAG: pseudouridine synthase [Lentimonas sp.]